MADLSAGGPLPLPEKIFSEEDVEAAVQRLIEGAWEGDGGAGTRDDLAEIARVVLTSAAARGRLLPPSAEHREEWNVRLPKPGGYSIVDDSMTKTWPPERGEIRDDVAWWKEHASLDVIPVKRTVTQFGDGSWLTGPWVQVDGSTSDEH